MMEKDETEKIDVRRGDMVVLNHLVVIAEDDEVRMMRSYWSLARVTAVAPDGQVSAYRQCGAHHVSRDVPDQYIVAPVSTINLPAIEHDMNAKVRLEDDANEFPTLQDVLEYVKPFMAEEKRMESDA
jgi:hypothetical protein